MFKKRFTKLLLMAIALTVIPATHAAPESLRINQSGEVANDRLMYSIGGGSVVGNGISSYRPGYTVGLGWKANMMCGNFDLKMTVKNQLNGLVEGFKDLMGDVIQNAQGAVASLPAMILQRANPGLYELLTNGVMQARVDFDRSKLSCEQMANRMLDVAASNGWGELSTGQSFADKVGSGGNKVDAVQTMKDTEKQKGEEGIKWFDGQKYGGKDQPPIEVVNHTVRSGYNLLHRRNPEDQTTISASSCDGGQICSVWDKPEKAAEFAKEVLGEVKIRTCQDGCEPREGTPGIGLTQKIQKTFEEKYQLAKEMVGGAKEPDRANLKELGSGMLPVSRGVIEALRSDPDRELLTRRLASELSMSAVLEQALLLQRMLIAGARNPNVDQVKPAEPELQKNLEALKAEIELLRIEMQVRQYLATNTAQVVLDRQNHSEIANKATPSDNTDPGKALHLNRETP